MIQRVNDFSSLSNSDFEKLSNIIQKKENKKLIKICSDEREVIIAKKEIKLSGLNPIVEQVGNTYSVYSVMPEHIDLKEAEASGKFEKLAWGRYCLKKENAIGDLGSYNFDDGPIWKVITTSDGKQVLVKEVEDENGDEDIVRTAGTLKESNTICIIDDNNFPTIMQILYHNSSTPNSEFLNDILNNTIIKQQIYSILSEKIQGMISEKLQQQNLTDDGHISKVVSVIQDGINNNKVTDENTLEAIIYNCIQEIMYDAAASINNR